MTPEPPLASVEAPRFRDERPPLKPTGRKDRPFARFQEVEPRDRSLPFHAVWPVLALLFVAPFIDPKRPFRILHLDLLVLLAFGISHFFFVRGNESLSVPLVYPVLVYLLARMLVGGFRPRVREGPLIPLARVNWLVVGLCALVLFRIVLNLVDADVVDTGYGSVIGADRIGKGEEVYASNFPEANALADNYGTVAYLMYVPFEQLFPWSGEWDSLPAARAATITFDLLTLAGLFVLGTRLRAGAQGVTLGIALAFAWASYPYAHFIIDSNSNDSLITMFIVWALVAIASVPARAALISLAGAAKFGPMALAPLFASGTGPFRLKTAILFSGVVIAVFAITLIPWLPPGGIEDWWNFTFGFQLFDRPSTLSLWVRYPELDPLRFVLSLAGVGFAILVAFVPRQRNPAQVAALGAAVTIAIQLPVRHWYYTYIAMFAPLALAALFAEYQTRSATPAGRRVGSEPSTAGRMT